MTFDFATAGRIVFGWGVLEQAGKLAAGLGQRPLLVSSRPAAALAPLRAALEAQGLVVHHFPCKGEPSLETAQEGARAARDCRADCVIGYGGGSALDTAKAVAALATNSGPARDYLEVVGRGLPLESAPLPLLAIPTTAGTGSEVTRNAVLGVADARVKVSLRHPGLLPRVALVDPALTLGLPPELTAHTGLDALTQLIEPFLSPRATVLTDALCREALPRAARALPRVFRSGQDREAREQMALASLFGGLALANAGLGAVHGFAGPLGGLFPAPHGAVCGRLLPFVLEANHQALLDREPASPALERYRELGVLLTGDPRTGAREALDWVHELCRELAPPPLSSYGIKETDFTLIVEKAQAASSMKANPLVLKTEELRAILHKAL